MGVPDAVGLPEDEGVIAPEALCVGEGVPLGDAACVTVNEGVLDAEAPRESVMVGEPEAVGATEDVELGETVGLAVLIREAATAEGDCVAEGVELDNSDGATEGAGVCA